MSDRSRRAILREQTAEAHASLDRTISTFDSLSSYQNYLRGMSAFRTAMEDRMATGVWPEALSSWDQQRFSALISEDLCDLGVEAEDRIESPNLLFAPEDVLGMLYVLEGSALGARLLYKRAQALGLTGDFGARHLAVQSERSDRWSRFLSLLESADAIEIDRVVHASTATFGVAEKAFQKAFHEQR